MICFAFLDLVANHVDILFANEAEITALYERNTFEAAAEAARTDVALAALTRSEAGSLILHGDETLTVAAVPTAVVDTTGAGDAYAAGFLAGLTGGIVVSPQATLAVIGPEAELYLDRVSLEGWAGFASLNYVDPALVDKTGVFAIGDLAYYPMDDWRFVVGGSYVLGDLSVHGGTEYLFRGLGAPISAVADARYHANGNYTFTVGIKGYFGGNDDGKSLIDRHR